MNKILKRRLYESIMKSISKTIKKKLNEVYKVNAYDEIDENSYGYKWCIANAEDPGEPVLLYLRHDEETDTSEPYIIVRNAGDNYYEIISDLEDYLRVRDICPYGDIIFGGEYSFDNLGKHFYDAYDNGDIYDLEYENGNVHKSY